MRQRRRDAPASASTSQPSSSPPFCHCPASKRAKAFAGRLRANEQSPRPPFARLLATTWATVMPRPRTLLALLVCSHWPGRRLHADLCSFARKGRSEGRGEGRRVRDDLLVDADADAEDAHADHDADAEAHVVALVVVAGTLAVRVVIGSVARLRCRNAVCFSPARASGLVR